MLHGVADQVVDDLAQAFLIGVDDDRVVSQEGDPAARVYDADGLDRLRRDARQVDVAPVQGAVGVQSGQHQQVLDEPAHPAGLVVDKGHQPQQLVRTGRIALLQAEFSQSPNGRQRRAQLMTRVGDELPHPVFRPEGTCLALFARPVRGLDPAEHGVQRIGQTADLGAARGMVDAPRKVTAGDRRGRRLIRLSGARLTRTSGSPMPASTAIAIAPASASAISRRVTVLLRLSRLNAMITCRPPESGSTRTRQESVGVPAADAVNGLPYP